ncbi:MAG: TIM barrel protein, partial [Phycisphaerales bacterium]|nr:TIM barrel protein [Phycisphaerales bacterium]
RYAPHFGMFSNLAGGDRLDEIRFAADQGFTAWEHNGMAGETPEFQDEFARVMDQCGMAMGVFVVSMETAWGPHFVRGAAESREKFLADCRKAVEVAGRVDAKWMTVVPGTRVPNLEMGYQTANVVDQLRAAAEIFETHGLVMVLEPLNPWRDHPDMFLSKIPQAYEVCRAVDSPSCKILFDIYHQQITEGNLIPNMNLAWSEIAYFQIGDNPGRNEPGTGEINYRNVFGHIHAKGFDGIMGMEHGKSKGGAEGDQALLEAYRKADGF